MSLPLDHDLSLHHAPTLHNQHSKRNSESSGARDILFGSIAGVCGKIVEYPFDTVKVKLQTQALWPSSTKAYSGAVDCFRKTYRVQGVHGLYRGLSSPLIGSVIENATLFFTYNAIQHKVPQPSTTPSLPHLFLCGGIAGFFTSFILTPIELVKCQMQVLNGTSPLLIMRRTVRTYGLRGFYRGHFATMVRESGGSAAWFGSYEFANHQFISCRNMTSKSDLSVSELLISGACAGISYNVVLFPADVIKSRMQTSSCNFGFWKTGANLHRAEGLRGLYRGCWVTVVKSTPTSAVIFGVYEWLNRSF